MKLKHAPKPPPPRPQTKQTKLNHAQRVETILGTWTPPKKARRENKST